MHIVLIVLNCIVFFVCSSSSLVVFPCPPSSRGVRQLRAQNNCAARSLVRHQNLLDYQANLKASQLQHEQAEVKAHLRHLRLQQERINISKKLTGNTVESHLLTVASFTNMA